jgi:hypothetical protein
MVHGQVPPCAQIVQLFEGKPHQARSRVVKTLG